LVDGEFFAPATQAYPSTTEADWTPHQRWLTHDGKIKLDIGCFLIRTGARRILVDAGLGTLTLGDGTYSFTGGHLLDELAKNSTTTDDITDADFTHHHFDNVGRATQHTATVFG